MIIKAKSLEEILSLPNVIDDRESAYEKIHFSDHHAFINSSMIDQLGTRINIVDKDWSEDYHFTESNGCGWRKEWLHLEFMKTPLWRLLNE